MPTGWGKADRFKDPAGGRSKPNLPPSSSRANRPVRLRGKDAAVPFFPLVNITKLFLVYFPTEVNIELRLKR
jgi:hypothetical protein